MIIDTVDRNKKKKPVDVRKMNFLQIKSLIPSFSVDQLKELSSIIRFWIERRERKESLTKDEIVLYNEIIKQLKARKRLQHQMIKEWAPFGAKIQGFTISEFKQAYKEVDNFIKNHVGRGRENPAIRIRIYNMILDACFMYMKERGYTENNRIRLFRIKRTMQQARKLIQMDGYFDNVNSCIEFIDDLVDDVEDIIRDSSNKDSIDYGFRRLMECLKNIEMVMDYCYPGYRTSNVLGSVLCGTEKLRKRVSPELLDKEMQT